MAMGLLELHTKGIVFEDMKPSNVMLDAASRAFLADFGVSKPMRDLSKVYTKNAAGTYLFMPPEKLRPRSGANVHVGFAADIWSFGITVLQLLLSNLDAPYGPGIDIPDIVFMLHVDKEAPRVPAVPDAPELQHTLQACLSLDHKERPSAAQLVQALQRVSRQLEAATHTSVNAAQGSSVVLAEVRALSEALKAQLAAPEARAAAAERKLAEEARQRQGMAREVEQPETDITPLQFEKKNILQALNDSLSQVVSIVKYYEDQIEDLSNLNPNSMRLRGKEQLRDQATDLKMKVEEVITRVSEIDELER
ncbi:kinase-like domain-containing protein [Dunaliella salina]|uniref:Kinase-like domain-containing protein n=1 Tax=Dunaliella salina TaxID=3046 RepID=A0ABQ7G350_DUNSA|nr:kinase-like domain-containing protein [Dunaliella salina]|eukprot:KAF5829017.1 kinase-like domain-containing protein [Dunaliella salina]